MKKILRNIVVLILEYEARLVLKKYKPKVIAITGSVGKTSTKDAIYSVLAKQLHVRRTKKSFNSEFGLPLTILDCDTGWNNPILWIKNILKGVSLIVFNYEYPSWLILEVGADHPGDIERAAKWLKTDIVVYTKFADVPVHVEYFKSPEEVYKEKEKLITSLRDGGVLILNNDDERIAAFAKKEGIKSVLYGIGKGADVRATHARVSYNDKNIEGYGFRLEINGESSTVKIKSVIGDHHLYPALAAAAIGNELGMEASDILEYVTDYEPPKGRLRLIEGLKGSMIIDDTYNSSPVAIGAALDTLAKLKVKGKKICVLGDMLELGKYATDAHKVVGLQTGAICDLLYVVGPRSKHVVEGALLGGLSEKNIREFSSSREVGKYMEGVLQNGDIALIKGSQSMRMEKAVHEIMLKPELHKQLLVRQEDEWLNR